MVSNVSAGLILVSGLINFLPLLGVLSAERLSKGYGVDIEEPNLVLLMRHRALMLGLIGGFMMVSAFRPVLQPSAFFLGFTSMIGFLVIAAQVGALNESLKKVVRADIVATAALAVAAILYLLEQAET